MRRMLLIESAVDGVLFVNGQFCGPVEESGQAFPCGKNEEIYIQVFPFGEYMPLTAKLIFREGRIDTLEPKESCFALLWPGGIAQLELRMQGQTRDLAQEQQPVPDVLLRYLSLRLAGDERSRLFLMRQDEGIIPDLSEYHAVVPLKFAPQGMDERFDMRAGLVRRIAQNVACVDAALGATVPAGQGRRLIESVEIMRT